MYSLQAHLVYGDNPGVAADKYVNIWYLSTNLLDNEGNEINQPFFAVSTDGGITYQLVYTLPDLEDPTSFLYDFPQLCFAGDGFGNYGIQYTTDYVNEYTGDISQIVGFIPIYGLGSFGSPTTPYYLSDFLNTSFSPSITASLDGRVWIYGLFFGYGTGITSTRMIFKSPGPTDQNIAGPWDCATLNQLNFTLLLPTYIQESQPFFGYFHSPRSIFYDDKRQALYLLSQAQSPDFSQNMRLQLMISCDNGQTLTNGLDISNSDFGNRGFESMALDPVRGDLYFGWYDGRNDPTYQSVEYYGAVIPAKQLDKLVKKIPLSNPQYTLPPAGIPFTGQPIGEFDQTNARKKKVKKKRNYFTMNVK